jgi:hypothetical protein
MKKYIILFLFSCISIFLGGIFLKSMLYYTDGHLAPPLDDTFIFLQYARQICNGALFQYNTGDTPTTGATSLLYPFILAIGFLSGFGETNILIYTFGLGVLFLIIGSLMIFNIGMKLFDKTIGLFLGLIFIFNGPILWSYFCGMETGFFITMILCTGYFFLIESEKRKYKYTILFASIMALTRPEGLILSIILFFVTFLLRKERNYYFLIPIGCGMIFVIINYIFSGSLTFNTMIAKSPLSRPNPNLFDIIATAGKYYFYLIKEIFAGVQGEYISRVDANDSQEAIYFAPFSLFFGFLGIIFLLTREIKNKSFGFGTLTFCWFMIGLFALCISLPVKWHWHRYLIPFYPLFLIFMISGIFLFSQIICKAWSACSLKSTFFSLFFFFFFWGIINTMYFSIAYGKNCKDIYNQQMRLGNWINQHLSKDVVIGVNDLGALKYFGKRYTIDLLGLGTNGAGWAWVNGTGSIFEFLESFDIKKYPDYLIIYPSWFGFDKIGILKEEIARFKLIDPSIAGSPSPMIVYKVDWNLAHKGDKICSVMDKLKGYRLVDYIDVGDVENEKKHNYKFWETQPGMFYGLIYQNEAHKYPYWDNPSLMIVDGGRIITGGEKMKIHTIPGKELKIVKRTSTYTPVEVWINGEFLGVWTHQSTDGYWSETIYTIPGNKITSNYTNISFPLHRDLIHYYVCFSAYYWFYQKY